MTLDIVTKGIPFLHMAIVAAMVFAGVPRILLGISCLMAIQTSVWLGSLLFNFTECLI